MKLASSTVRLSVIVGAAVLAIVAGAACDDDSKPSDPVATPTPRSIPSPVPTPPATAAGFTLADPALEALPGAAVDFGQLGGMTYQIEIPADWNNRLVMYTHGNDVSTELAVYPPVNRNWLIKHGYAWAAASYTVNVAYVSGVAADETAALWDYFVSKHGRPAYTYAMGDSMGGAAAFTAAERYANRYDGALPLCADAPPSRVEGDFFYAAAFAAGVTQTEYDASDIGSIIDARIKPALRDPAIRSRFDALWADLSGGPRPFVAEGVAISWPTVWNTAISNVISGIDGNDAVEYELGEFAGVSSADFNRDVIRVKVVPGADKYADRNLITGDIQVPVLTLQPTGDAETVFSSSQDLRRRVEAKGNGDLLVQRAIQSPQHCFDHGVADAELATSIEALVAWVELGTKPEGEDLLGDVSDAGARFTLVPRLGSDAANAVPGAGERVTLRGRVTLDGQPVTDAFMWALVRNNGLTRPCSYQYVVLNEIGEYRLAVAADAENRGCGAPGAEVTLALFVNGERYLSDTTFPWPASPGEAAFDATFSSGKPAGDNAVGAAFFGTFFGGDVVDRNGQPVAPGTVIEARVGETLCGVSSVAPVQMVFGREQGYQLQVSSPDALPGCTKDGVVTFRVNNQEVEGTGVNDLSQQREQTVDLRLN